MCPPKKRNRKKGVELQFKSYQLIIAVILMTIFLSFNVSAEREYDNVKDSYNETTKTITIRDNFGFGGILGTMKLDTEQEHHVMGTGERLIALLNISLKQEYDRVVTDITSYDLNDNNKKIDKAFTFKRGIIEGYDEANFTNSTHCYIYNKEDDVYDKVKGCVPKLIKTKRTPIIRWEGIDLEKGDKPKGEYITGVFVNIENLGENVEVIYEFMGVSCPEFASYLETLSAKMTHNWNLDNLSDGSMPDIRGNELGNAVNLSHLNTNSYANTSGWINGSMRLDGTGEAKMQGVPTAELKESMDLQHPITICNAHYEIGHSGGGDSMFGAGDNALDGLFHYMTSWAGDTQYNLHLEDSVGGDDRMRVSSQVASTLGRWVFSCMTYNGSTGQVDSVNFYEDGALLGSDLDLNGLGAETYTDLDNVSIGHEPQPQPKSFNGWVDEFYIFNEELSPSEIADLNSTWANRTSYGGQVVTEYPQFTNILDNNNTIIYEGTVNLTSTITSTNGTAGVEFNGTNYTSFNETTTTFNVSFIHEGSGVVDYYWWAWGNSSTADYNTTTLISYTIITDEVAPNLTITSPTDGINSTDTNLEINYTVSDVAIQNCWYTNDTNTENVTLACGTNITGVSWIFGQHNVTIWANDTTGNLNSSVVTFNTVGSSLDLLFTNNTNWTDYKTLFKEGENFVFWWNWTDHNENILGDSDGECNFTAFDVTTEVEAVNQSFDLCDAGKGCDIDNPLQETFTMETSNATENITRDFATIEICHAQTISRDLTVTFTCSGGGTETVTVNKNQFGLCSGGFSSVIVETTACMDQTVINISLDNNAVVSTQRHNISEWEFDREIDIHTDTYDGGEVYFNSTYNLWASNDSYERYKHGTVDLHVNCTHATESGYDNNTEATITIENTDPIIGDGEVILPSNTKYSINSTNPTNPTVIEYEAGQWRWEIPIIDDDLDTHNLTWYDSSEVGLQSNQGTEAISSHNTTDALFPDFLVGNTYNLSIWANDTNANETQKNFYFNVTDTVVPDILIAFPTNDTNTTDANINVNYTVSDESVQTCWWTNNSGISNTTITCGNNITGQTWSLGLNTVVVYTNDSANSGNSSFVSFTITVVPTPVLTGLTVASMILGYHADLIKFEDTGLTFTYRR